MLTLGEITEALHGRLLDPGADDAAEEGRTRAAVAVVLREPETPSPDGVELLLIKRAENPRDHWSGHMALPGGRWEPQDGSLAATAVRETFEEVGISIPLDRVVGRMPRLRPANPRLPAIDITPYVAVAPHAAEVSPNHEVAAHFWVPLSWLHRTGPSAVYVLDLVDEQREWPAYPFGEHLIWGLTERILSNFLALLHERKES
jgi:8-oxo-dGTP pyrophosphatase MutT (NUDIX family)